MKRLKCHGHFTLQAYETVKEYSFIAAQGTRIFKQKVFFRFYFQYIYNVSFTLTTQKMTVYHTGPKEQTLEDFWRMVMQYSVPVVVMLTKCFEEGSVSF